MVNKVTCTGCREEIHPIRLEILPHTKTCMKCSTESKKAGRIVSYGTGEDVEVRLEIHDRETFKKLHSYDKPPADFNSEFDFDDDEEMPDNELLNYTNIRSDAEGES